MNRGDLFTVALQGEHGKPRPALVIQSDLFAKLTSTVTIALPTTAALDIPIWARYCASLGFSSVRRRRLVAPARMNACPPRSCRASPRGTATSTKRFAIQLSVMDVGA